MLSNGFKKEVQFGKYQSCKIVISWYLLLTRKQFYVFDPRNFERKAGRYNKDQGNWWTIVKNSTTKLNLLGAQG